MWGEISSSSWGKETIRSRVSYQTRSKSEPNLSQSETEETAVVKSMRRGFDFTKSKEW